MVHVAVGLNKGMSVLDLCHKILSMSSYPLIIDTNVLLDLFVFEDQRATFLQEEINNKKAQMVYCPEMIEEFSDVLGRTQFGLSDARQKEILRCWQDMGTLIPIHEQAPLQCSDPDDQIFIHLAYQLRPAILVSKDRALINLRKRLVILGIELKTY